MINFLRNFVIVCYLYLNVIFHILKSYGILYVRNTQSLILFPTKDLEVFFFFSLLSFGIVNVVFFAANWAEALSFGAFFHGE